MKTARLAIAAAIALSAAACGGNNQDQLDSEDINAMPSLDELSDDAANVAAATEALENETSNLEEAVDANATGPETPADENIAGM